MIDGNRTMEAAGRRLSDFVSWRVVPDALFGMWGARKASHVARKATMNDARAILDELRRGLRRAAASTDPKAFKRSVGHVDTKTLALARPLALGSLHNLSRPDDARS